MEYLEGKPLINQKKRVILANDALNKAKLIMFLFSAGWCHHCQTLTPKLIEIYEEGKNREIDLEIINVPNDRTLKDFIDNFKSQGNWYSLIYGDTLAQELIWTFNITHVPSIIVTTKDGHIITKNGYNEILSIGINVLVTWT